MTLQELEAHFNPVNPEKIRDLDVEDIEGVYQTTLNDEARTLVLLEGTHISLGDGFFLRTLSREEILHASEELQVDFQKLRSIPFIDTGDNDFLLYNYRKQNFYLFNIADECDFDTFDTVMQFIQSRNAS